MQKRPVNLEEKGQTEQTELVRLTQTNLTRREERMQELLSAGVLPVVPEVVNSIGMRLALIPPGCFLMGSPEDEEDRNDDEGPQHEVQITKAFYLGVYPVTQSQWQNVMGSNPSWFSATGASRLSVRRSA